MSGILVCAATRAEAAACRRGIGEAGAASRIEVLRTGVGPLRAGRALRTRFSSGRLPSLVISAGFAGGNLALQSWITAGEVWLHHPESGFRRVGAQSGRDAVGSGALALTVCDFVTGHGLGSETLVREFQGMRIEHGAPVAVDMESGALAEICAASSVPFMVLRFVTDNPENPLPDFLHDWVRGPSPRAVWTTLREPRGLLRLLRNGPRWLAALQAGWSRIAGELQKRPGGLSLIGSARQRPGGLSR